MKKNSEYIEIDLGRLFKALKKKFWVLILAALFFGALGYSYAKFMIVPTYRASALMYVNNNSLSIGKTISLSSSDLFAGQELVDTYIVILKTRTTLNEVIERAGLRYSYEQLNSMISAAAKGETAIFSITVTSTDPQEAAKIANMVAEVLPQKIADILEGSSARIVDYAVVPSGKSAPNNTFYAMIGVIAGLLVSGLTVIVLELMNDSIQNAEMLPDGENIPVLAEIPSLTAQDKSGDYKYSYGKNQNTGRGKKE